MKFIKAVLIGAFTFFVVYLLGSFASLSFDISEWTEACRFLVALVGGMIALPAFGYAMEAV